MNSEIRVGDLGFSYWKTVKRKRYLRAKEGTLYFSRKVEWPLIISIVSVFIDSATQPIGLNP